MTRVSNGFLAVMVPLVVCACAEEPLYSSDEIRSAHVSGSFDAPSDPAGIWYGMEQIEAFDRGGTHLCSREWEMEALEVNLDDDCHGCSVALEVTTVVAEAAGSDCSELLDGLGRVHYELPIIGYAGTGQSLATAKQGKVFLQSGDDPTWILYSTADFEDGELTYLHEAPSAPGSALQPIMQGVEVSPLTDDLTPPEL